jgi:hypothetical protein
MMDKPRRAGRLHIGTVLYTGTVFTVDMVFESASHFPGDDEMKSAALAARQHFYRLLHENGYHSHGLPEVKVTPKGSRSLHIVMGCEAEKKKPAIVMLRGDHLPMKDDDEGRGPLDDKT